MKLHLPPRWSIFLLAGVALATLTYLTVVGQQRSTRHFSAEAGEHGNPRNVSAIDSVKGERSPAGGTSCPVHLQIHSACVGSRFRIELEHRGDSGVVRHSTTTEELASGLSPGAYSVQVERPGWVTGKASFVVPTHSVDPIGVSVQVEPMLTMRGQLQDAVTREPVSSWSVVAEAMYEFDAAKAFSISDECPFNAPDGVFCLPIEETRATQARALVRAEGYDDLLTDWSPLSGRTFHLGSILLDRAPKERIRLSGSVMDASGSEIAGAIVRVTQQGDGVSRIASLDGNVEIKTMSDEIVTPGTLEEDQIRYETVSARDGSFSLRMFPERVVTVHVFAEGFRPWSSDELPLQESLDESLEVLLQRAASIFCQVHMPLEPSARPRSSQIHVVGPALRLMKSFSIDAESGVSTCLIEGLPPGRYDVMLMAQPPALNADMVEGKPMQPVVVRRVEVGEGVSNVDLYYNSGLIGGSIRGALSIPPAIDASSVVVHVFTDSEPHPCRTDWLRPDGSFEVLDLAPGRYGVLVTGVGGGGTPCLATFAEATVTDGVAYAVRFETSATLRATGVLEKEHGKRAFIGIGCLEGTPLMLRAFNSSVTVVSDENGQFVVYGLPPGTYRFRTRDLLYEDVVSIPGPKELTEVRLIRTSR